MRWATIKFHSRCEGCRGFTLIEVLLTNSVLGILVTLALPNLGGLMAKWQRDSATRAFVDHLQLARAMAIKSSKRVVVCCSENGIQCTDSSEADWRHGWLIFRDENANKAFDQTDTVIAVAGPRSGLISFRSSNHVRRFDFLPSGLMASGMSSMVVSPTSGAPMRIIVNRVGRLRLSEAGE
ncbi:MAG: GspH/FimT family pseudopilin [Burkholderiaceae bacterium]